MVAVEAFLIIFPFLLVGGMVVSAMNENTGIGDVALSAVGFAFLASAGVGLVIWLATVYIPFIQGLFA